MIKVITGTIKVITGTTKVKSGMIKVITGTTIITAMLARRKKVRNTAIITIKVTNTINTANKA